MAPPSNPARKADILKRIEAYQANVESNKGGFHLYPEKENELKSNMKLVCDMYMQQKGGKWGRLEGVGRCGRPRAPKHCLHTLSLCVGR